MVARVQTGEAPESSNVDAIASEGKPVREPNDELITEQSPVGSDAEDVIETEAAPQSKAEATRTDVVFDPADSAYRAAYSKGAQTASGEGKSIFDRERTETVLGETHRASPDEKTRITRNDDV